MAATIAVCAYLYLRLDDEIRRYSEQLLASHYSEFRVQVGSARFVQGRGIIIYDLSISDPNTEEAHQTLLHVDELQLLGKLGTHEVLSCNPEMDQIVVKRPQLFARRGANQHWNITRLWPLPKFGDCAPPVRVEDATLMVSDEAKPQKLPLVVRDVDLEMARERQELGGEPVLRFFGMAGRPLAEKISFNGEQVIATGEFDLTCQVVQLDVTPELLANLPLDGLAEGIELRGQVDFNLEAHRAAGADAKLNWKLNGLRLANGRLTHPRLPRRINDLQATGECDQDGLTINACTGKYGTSDVALTCRRTGWHSDAPLVLWARAVNLPLDKQLESSLPPSLWKWWDRYRPAGNVTATLNSLTFNGREWLPDVTIECHQVSFADYEKFPYRMQDATGTLRYYDVGEPQGAELAVNLQPTMQNRPVSIVGHLVGLPSIQTLGTTLPPPVGFFQCTGTKVIAHAELIDALEPKVAAILRSLHPSGEFSFTWRVERTSPQQAEPATSLTLDLLDGEFRYDHFPYLLSHVTGQIVAEGKHWTFQNLVARDERTGQTVLGSGTLEPTATGNQLQLTLHGTDVPLDNDLQAALSSELQELWTKLKPQGRINFSARVTHESGQQAKPSVEVVLEDSNRQVQLEPEFFPLRLEQMSGRVLVSPEKVVTLNNVRAKHGQMEMITQGRWQPLPSGGWEFNMHGLHVDRLTSNHDLTAAVPRELRKIMEQLKPQGNFAIQEGKLSFVQPNPGDLRLDSRWDIILDCHQADLHAGLPINDIFGSIRLVGGNVGGQCTTVGELQLESLVWHDVQFTGIRGPMWCDRSQCLFGQGATQRMGQPTRSVEAQTCGGRLAVNGNVLYDGYTRYGLSAEVRDLDLARFANEHLNGQGDLSGRVEGELRLQGQGNSLYGLEGGGKLTVNEANLYELPLLVSLLKVLRNRAPDSTAFNKVESEFSIHGDRVTLRKLDLLGDAVSFYGRGDAWFNKRIDLTFHSIIGRNELSIPVLRNFVGQASEQIMQLAVDGTLDDPQTHTKAFPGVTNMIEQFQSDLQNSEVPASAQQRALSAPR